MIEMNGKKKSKANTPIKSLLQKMKDFAERLNELAGYGSRSEKLKEPPIGIKKEYLKGLNVCRVTFRLPKAAAPDAKSVYIVGDFNNWNIHATPMKTLEDGDYTVRLDLDAGKEYQFRYLIDEVKWENDWNADKYVKSPYGDNDNSVVVT